MNTVDQVDQKSYLRLKGTNGMEFEISTSEDGLYLKVVVFEAITGEIERTMMGAVAKEITGRGISNVLVDVRKVRNIASIHDNFSFANYDAKHLGFPKDSRVGILVSPDDDSHAFVETVFQNAEYACRIFENEGVAVEWLLD